MLLGMTSITYPHVQIREGTAYVAGSETKVVEIVLEHLAHHWHADDIQRQHPHLSMAQVHAALAYYYDHQAELEREIADRRERVAAIRERVADDSVRLKLQRVDRE